MSVPRSKLEHMFDSVAQAPGKLHAARAALARAELAAGVRSKLELGVAAAGGGVASQANSKQKVGAGPSAAEQGTATGDGLLAGLQSVLPGGLTPGGILAVQGSNSFRGALAATAMGNLGWAAFVGNRDVGWVAAAEAGLDLARVVVVPAAGPAAAQVVAACIDAFSVVVLGDIALSPGERRSLAGRVRSNATVLLANFWPGAPTLQAGVRGGEISPDGLISRLVSVTRDGFAATALVRVGVTPQAAGTEVAVTVQEATPYRHLRAV